VEKGYVCSVTELCGLRCPLYYEAYSNWLYTSIDCNPVSRGHLYPNTPVDKKLDRSRILSVRASSQCCKQLGDKSHWKEVSWKSRRLQIQSAIFLSIRASLHKHTRWGVDSRGLVSPGAFMCAM